MITGSRKRSREVPLLLLGAAALATSGCYTVSPADEMHEAYVDNYPAYATVTPQRCYMWGDHECLPLDNLGYDPGAVKTFGTVPQDTSRWRTDQVIGRILRGGFGRSWGRYGGAYS